MVKRSPHATVPRASGVCRALLNNGALSGWLAQSTYPKSSAQAAEATKKQAVSRVNQGVRVIAPPSARDTPSLGINFEAGADRLKRSERTGIPKKTPVREAGCCRGGLRLVGFHRGRRLAPQVSSALGPGQVCQDFGGVPFGSNRRPDRCNFASFADQE